MKPKQQQIIFYILFISLILLYFLPELRLIIRDVVNNRLQKYELFTERIREIKSDTYSVELKPSDFNSIDFDKSYLVLSGSNYLFEKDLANYSFFLDKTVPFTKVPFTDSKVRVDSIKKSIFITDTNKIPASYSVISEVYIYDSSGVLKYDWEIAPFYKGGLNYWNGRLSYLSQILVWFFAIFGFFRLKKAWTVIYDSKTKKPVSGAIVRIYSDGRLVKTAITSVIGFIDVRLGKGKYTISVIKQGYTFPSNLAPLVNDDYYNNLYYGSEVTITKNNARLKLNIPLDPEGEAVRSSAVNIALSGFLSMFDSANPVLLLIVAGSQIIFWPKYIDTWIFATITAILFGIKYFVKKSSKLYNGTVVDRKGNRVPNITFNLYDTQWEKFVRSFTSDLNGNYESIEVPNSYYVKLANPEWKMVEASDGKLVVKGKQVGAALFINDEIIVEAITPPLPQTPSPTHLISQ